MLLIFIAIVRPHLFYWDDFPSFCDVAFFEDKLLSTSYCKLFIECFFLINNGQFGLYIGGIYTPYFCILEYSAKYVEVYRYEGSQICPKFFLLESILELDIWSMTFLNKIGA